MTVHRYTPLTVTPAYSTIPYFERQHARANNANNAGVATGGAVVTMLDKTITLDGFGMPAQVTVGTAAKDGNTANAIQQHTLAKAVHVTLTSKAGAASLVPKRFTVVNHTGMAVHWYAHSGTASGDIQLAVNGSVDVTGYMDYQLSG